MHNFVVLTKYGKYSRTQLHTEMTVMGQALCKILGRARNSPSLQHIPNSIIIPHI